MSLKIRVFCLWFFATHFLLAADSNHHVQVNVSSEITDINFANDNRDPFILRALHKVSRDFFVEGYYQLFQDNQVNKYYERGGEKSISDCQKCYDSRVSRLENWDQENLGWVAILDEQGQFVGFIGGNIKDNAIELCIAIASKYQQSKVALNGLSAYFSYFWPRLKPSVQEKIKDVKCPINPRNEASKGLSEKICAGSISSNIYVPSYYAAIAKEKGERVDSIIPIAKILRMLEIDRKKD